MGNSLSLQDLDAIIARLRKVMSGDLILAEDHNDLVDAVKAIRDILAQQAGAPTVANPSGHQPHDVLCKLCEDGLDIACDWVAYYTYLPFGWTPPPVGFIATDFPSNAVSGTIEDCIYAMYPHNTEYSATYVSPEYLDKILSWLRENYRYRYSEYLEKLGYFRTSGEVRNLGFFISLKGRDNMLSSSHAPFRLIYNLADAVEVRMKPDGCLAVVKGSYNWIGYPLSSPEVIDEVSYDVMNNWLLALTDWSLSTLLLISKDLTIIKTYDISSIIGYTPDSYDFEAFLGYVNTNGEKATFMYDWLWVYLVGYKIA